MTAKAAPDKPDHRIGSTLVVEDDPILSLAIEDILTRGGAPKVTVCASTRAALSALEKERFELLVLDVHLVDRDDGWAVAELVTQLGPQPPRIIFSTGTPEAIPKSIAGLGTVLTKPYEPETLLAAARDSRRTGLLSRLRGAISSE